MKNNLINPDQDGTTTSPLLKNEVIFKDFEKTEPSFVLIDIIDNGSNGFATKVNIFSNKLIILAAKNIGYINGKIMLENTKQTISISIEMIKKNR